MAVIDLAFDEIFEEAYDRIGVEMRNGYQLRSIIRTFNILMNNWANRGLNLWSVADTTLNCVVGTATYTIPTDTVDLLDQTIRDPSSNQEIWVSRIAVGTWAKETQKSLPGRPTQVYVERTTTPQITLWPVPDRAYIFRYWYIRRLDGLASGVSGSPDIPSRFVEPLIAGLAYNMALKSTDQVVMQKLPLLKQLYEEAYELAATEDRDRAGLRITPRICSV